MRNHVFLGGCPTTCTRIENTDVACVYNKVPIDNRCTQSWIQKHTFAFEKNKRNMLEKIQTCLIVFRKTLYTLNIKYTSIYPSSYNDGSGK